MKMVKRIHAYLFYVSLYTTFVWSLEYSITQSTVQRDVKAPVGTMFRLNCIKKLDPDDDRLVWYKESDYGYEFLEFKDGFCVLNMTRDQPLSMKTENCDGNKISIIFTNIQYRHAGSWHCRTEKWSSEPMRINVTSDTDELPNSSCSAVIGVGVAGWVLVVIVGIVGCLVYRKKGEDAESILTRNLSDHHQTSVNEYSYANDLAIRSDLPQTARQGSGNARWLSGSDGYITPITGSRGVGVMWL